MTSFLEIYEQRNSIEDKFFKMVEDTRESREIEYKAALTIQAAFHRFIFRKYFAELNKQAIIIQKTFRMYRARILVKCLRVEQEQALQERYFNREALKIQKAWRKFVADGKVSIPKSSTSYVQHKVKIRKVIKRRKKKTNQDLIVF